MKILAIAAMEIDVYATKDSINIGLLLKYLQQPSIIAARKALGYDKVNQMLDTVQFVH